MLVSMPRHRWSAVPMLLWVLLIIVAHALNISPRLGARPTGSLWAVTVTGPGPNGGGGNDGGWWMVMNDMPYYRQ
jgi:hypothetical protein